ALFVVLPSLWESLANATLEALDVGKPVVATLGCGFAEVIEDGESGLLVSPGDAAALRDALLWMLEDRTRLRRMSQAASARAERFRLPRVVAQLVDVYERVHARPVRIACSAGTGTARASTSIPAAGRMLTPRSGRYTQPSAET